MKIGILIDRLNVGGVEKAALQEVKAMRSIGIDARLLVLSRKAVVENAHQDLLSQIPVDYLEDFIPKVFRFSFKIPGFTFFSFFHISYPFLLSLFMRKDACDYIVSHGSYTTLSALILRLFRNIPYSIYFWDPTNYILKRVYKGKFPRYLLGGFAFLGRIVDKTLVRFADYVFVASDTYNPYLSNFVPEDKIIVVYPGTPIGVPTKEKEPLVLMVTTWKAGKHPEYVFDIIEKYPKVKIKMVGGWIDDDLKMSFINEMKNRHMEKNIELFGEANEKQLQELYPKAAVQLTTNMEKGFGMPVIEAAACGTVSIVPLGSGVCKVFESGKDAFYTKEHDTKNIVKHIRYLVEDLDKAIEMGLKSYNRVKVGHTWVAHSKKILKKIVPDYEEK